MVESPGVAPGDAYPATGQFWRGSNWKATLRAIIRITRRVLQTKHAIEAGEAALRVEDHRPRAELPAPGHREACARAKDRGCRGAATGFDPPKLPPVYTRALSDAVKNYQHRHGLQEDGKLTPETIKSLNVPLTERVIQLQDSLERWRWLPNQYVNAPLMVNLPEFVLRGYNPQHQLDFTMRVVVGKVVGDHDTPVFAHMMKYLVFRPYWNVPHDIVEKELMPHIRASGVGYLAAKNFEVTDSKGNVLTNFTAKTSSTAGCRCGRSPGRRIR